MKTRSFFVLISGLLCLNLTSGNAQNLLADGDFSVTTSIPLYTGGPGPAGSWYYYLNAGIDALPVVESGICRYNMVYGGYETWEVQLMQWGFPLIREHTYRLTFDVKADAERWFGVYLGEDGGNWTSILGYDQYWQFAPAIWKTISLEFTVKEEFPWHKFSLETGGGTGNMYFDNVLLEDLGKLPVRIGILGTALNGWDADVEMTTSDEVTYTLEDYPLKSGYCKFRQNSNWAVNWGSTDFPSGTAYLFGPDIPVYTAGDYDITFNRNTGEYSFVCVDQCAASVGILGEAVPPLFSWTEDVNMWSSDGVVYVMKNVKMSAGGAKFRLDDNWSVNWGGTGFPSGTAELNGPDIPVTEGVYNITFNIVTGEYLFNKVSVGILGSALNGWDTDIDLTPVNEFEYVLSDYPFNEGEVKFRLDNEWTVNWGNNTFPAGDGYQDGPNIPVPAGTFNVTFNLYTGVYLFEATSCPVPGIRCPENIYLGNEPGLCGAYVWFTDPVPAPDCGGDGLTLAQTGGLPSGSFFPVGVTTNSFRLTNKEGITAECSFDVVVYDIEPPAMSILTAGFDPRTPPDHKMVPVNLNYTTHDNCGRTYNEIYVYSNEPKNGKGDGNTLVDTQVLDDHHILIREERSGPGEGRTFYILVICRDEAWNTTYRSMVLIMPHDNRDGGMVGMKAATVVPSEADNPFSFQLWPNPSSGCFNLKIDGSSETVNIIKVTDIAGRDISSFRATGTQILQFGDELAPGLYLVNIIRGMHTEILKAVKK